MCNFTYRIGRCEYRYLFQLTFSSFLLAQDSRSEATEPHGARWGELFG